MTIAELFLLFVLPGAFGGLVRSLVGIAKSMRDGKSIKIGYMVFTMLVGVVVGALASVLVGGDWRISLLAGYAGSDIIEGLYKAKLFRLF